jgi:hypothetical protein
MDRRAPAILIAPALLFCLAAGVASAQTPHLSGYLKNFSIMYRLAEPADSGDLASPPLLGQSNTRLRLSLRYSPKDSLACLVAYDISPRVQDPLFFRASPFAVSIATGSYRVVDFRTPIIPGRDDPAGSFGLYHNLDRLSVTIRTKAGDLIVGRQPIAWGSGKITNPTDVIAPFSFYELDKEERFGVDAVRFRLSLGALSEFDAGYVIGERFRFARSAFFLRNRVHVLKTDVSVLLVGFQEDLLLGVDLARSLGGSGIWLEAAYVLPDALNRASPKPSDYGRITAGIDRSLTSRLYGFLEYHFNGAGSARPAAYAMLFSQPAYTRGTVYLMGRNYLSLGATYQAAALIPVTGLVIWNATDGSFALSPQAEYNIAQNIYLGGGAYLGIGRRPLTPLIGASSPPALRSEFGSYPDFLYVSFRVYF